MVNKINLFYFLNFKGKKTNSGFTLIELLVVIAIIGTLSALLLPNYMDTRMRARDAQRKSDLKTLQKAIEMYRLDHGATYPATDDFLKPSDNILKDGNNIYLPDVPHDPLSTSSNVIRYGYYAKDNNISYSLCACLENTADKDLLKSVPSPMCSNYACSNGGAKYELSF